MEQNSDLVSIGKTLHETSYQRDKYQEIDLDGIVKFDRIEKEICSGMPMHFIAEIKKSKAIDEAHILQMKFYLWYLKQKGIDGFKGKLAYPLLKKTEIIELGEEDEAEFQRIVDEIKMIANLEIPPKVSKMKICKSCSYEEMCWS